VNAGFENASISDGHYTSAGSAPWSFLQNSVVVDPFIAQTYDASGTTRAATYVPQEGEQYVSTYAGNGGVEQPITFDQPGLYRVSAYAASPSGSLFIVTPVVSGSFPMVEGEFRFRLGGVLFGETHHTPSGGPWTQFSSLLTIEAPTTKALGAKNTKGAVYFNYYDNFNIEYVGPIPEPMTGGLGLVAIILVGLMYRLDRSRSN